MAAPTETTMATATAIKIPALMAAIIAASRLTRDACQRQRFSN
jgi:hypothetical protein